MVRLIYAFLNFIPRFYFFLIKKKSKINCYTQGTKPDDKLCHMFTVRTVGILN